MEGHVNYLGRSDEPVTVGLNQVESTGQRDIFLEFRVPLWFDEFVSPQEFVKVEQLFKDGRFPAEGRIKLRLSGWQRFQMLTRLHPWLTLFAVGLLALVPVAIVRGKRMSKSSASPVPGYSLFEKVGEGAMGEVYRASASDGSPCALKLLRPMLSESPEFRRQFDQELSNYLPLRHPNILNLYGYGYAEDGRPYLVTEFLQGETLKERLSSTGADSQTAAEVLEQIGSALGYLHSKGLVHQDVKPSNIFFCRDGTLKLLDLGISRSVENLEGVAGTPLYMSPEQFQGQAGFASDQYSLGLVILELLQGKVSEQLDPSALAYRRAAAPPDMEVLPEAVREGLQRMLSPNPERRFADLSSARAALSDILFHSGFSKEADSFRRTP